MTGNLAILLLDGDLHDRASFDCGVEPLNSYLHDRAVGHAGKGISKTYVATPKTGREVLGFCSVAASSVQRSELSRTVQRRLGTYEQVPAIIIGQMAVQTACQRQGVGGSLLSHVLCLAASLSRKIGIALVILTARNEEVKQFYGRYGFRALPGAPLRLFISMREVRNFVTRLGCSQ